MADKYVLKTKPFGIVFHDTEKGQDVPLPKVLEMINKNAELANFEKEARKIKKHAEKIVEIIKDDEGTENQGNGNNN